MVAMTLIYICPFPIPSRGKLVGRLLYYSHKLSFLLFCIYLLMLCVYMCGYACSHKHVEDKGQLASLGCPLTTSYTFWHTLNCPIQVNKLRSVIKYFLKDCANTLVSSFVASLIRISQFYQHRTQLTIFSE